MGKSTKTQNLREKMRTSVKNSQQTTLESLHDSRKKAFSEKVVPESKKQIIVTEIVTFAKEDELALKVGFRLLPSKVAFSKVSLDLFFDGQKISCTCVSIPQGPLLGNAFELTPVLEMKGIPAGSHIIGVEMYELWSTGERFCRVTEEVSVDYVPITRAEKFVMVPIVKSVAGRDLEVVSESEKDIYREIEDAEKREVISKRDEW